MKPADKPKAVKPDVPAVDLPVTETVPAEPVDLQPRRRWLRWLVIAGGLVVIAMVVACLSVWRWYSTNLQPVEPGSDAKRIFVVSPGVTAAGIAQDLETSGLIRSSTAFQWYVTRAGIKNKLQAGTYSLGPGMTTPDIAGHFSAGLVDSNRITIPPGLRLDQIEELLSHGNFSAKEVKAALAKDYDHPLLKDRPAKASLEGYIFPDTYDIDGSTTVEGLLERVFDHFYAQLTDEMKAGFRRHKLDLHEAITLASIVQKESSDPVAQTKIAQVFLKRLDKGMVLGSDVTFIYAAALSGEAATPDLDSPYNTRKFGGLPPGPIGNFNLASLEAVASPAKTDWLYFVAGDDGVIYFSKTNEQHEEYVRKYCIEGCR